MLGGHGTGRNLPHWLPGGPRVMDNVWLLLIQALVLVRLVQLLFHLAKG